MMTGRPYITCWSCPSIGDNWTRISAKGTVGSITLLHFTCSMQVSAIPAYNWTFKKLFNLQDVYNKFYCFFVLWKDCSFQDARVKYIDCHRPCD